MRDVLKYILGILGLVVGGFLVWFFKAIVSFVLIGAVLSLIAKPFFDLFKKLRIKEHRLPDGLCAIITIVLIWAFVVGFFSFSIPLVLAEVQYLSSVNVSYIIDQFDLYFKNSFVMGQESEYLNMGISLIKEQMKEFIFSLFDFSKLKDFVASLAGFVGGTFIAIFSISFVSFFFLKDDWLLLEGILLFVPQRFEPGLVHIFASIRRLLRRYFVGVLFQIILIAAFVTIGFLVLGFDFDHSITIGLFCGVLNIIPYLGPLFGAFVGVLVGSIVYFQSGFSLSYAQMITGILFVFVIVQLLDNVVFQPVIFSSSVKAHPLEIFIVILMAGYLAGVPGMFLAIPVYTILRVIAREFFFNYRLVEKLTRKLDR